MESNPRKYVNDIVKPFFRGDESRTTKGSSLGLSLVRAIASLHADLKLSHHHSGLCVSILFK